MSQKHLQTMFIKSILHTVLLLSAACLSTFCADAASTSDGGNLLPEGHSSRRTLSLDGQWQVAEGKSDVPPTVFAHTVPVPGLVSLVKPAFDAPGPKVANRQSLPQKDPKRDAFWYRRTFTLDGQVPVVARLKVAKAMFGTRVFLNDTLLGDHVPSFTPGYFDATPALKTGRNEILIRVGADRDAVGRGYPDGFDFEKERYIPGIFDSVELILSGTPHLLSVQVAPDIEAQTVRVQGILRNQGEATKAVVKFVVHEVRSGKIAGRGTSEPVELRRGAETTVDAHIPLKDCHLYMAKSSSSGQRKLNQAMTIGLPAIVCKVGLRRC